MKLRRIRKLVLCNLKFAGVLVALAACSDNSPTIDPDPEDTRPSENVINNFQPFTIFFPSVFEINIHQSLDAEQTARQITIRASTLREGSHNLTEITCEVTVEATSAELAEVAYSELITTFGSDINLIEVSTATSVDGRQGQAILYNRTTNTGTINTRLAHAYYFNAGTDFLIRNWLYMVRCGGTTADFTNRRQLIDGVLKSMDFKPDASSNPRPRSVLFSSDKSVKVSGEGEISFNAARSKQY